MTFNETIATITLDEESNRTDTSYSRKEQYGPAAVAAKASALVYVMPWGPFWSAGYKPNYPMYPTTLESLQPKVVTETTQ